MVLAAAVLGLGTADASVSALPDSEHLNPVRPALERAIDQAERDGLPADLILSKVHEGLSKGAAPEAIQEAAERVSRSLNEADVYLRAHRAEAASGALIRAVAEARMVAVEFEVLRPMIVSPSEDAPVARAVETVTDLSLRGYPAQSAALVVRQVLSRDPNGIGRVTAGVEAIRTARTSTRTEALRTLEESFTGTGSLDGAVARTLEETAKPEPPAPVTKRAKGERGKRNGKKSKRR